MAQTYKPSHISCSSLLQPSFSDALTSLLLLHFPFTLTFQSVSSTLPSVFPSPYINCTVSHPGSRREKNTCPKQGFMEWEPASPQPMGVFASWRMKAFPLGVFSGPRCTLITAATALHTAERKPSWETAVILLQLHCL